MIQRYEIDAYVTNRDDLGLLVGGNNERII
jgi:hypothetical protein